MLVAGVPRRPRPKLVCSRIIFRLHRPVARAPPNRLPALSPLRARRLILALRSHGLAPERACRAEVHAADGAQAARGRRRPVRASQGRACCSVVSCVGRATRFAPLLRRGPASSLGTRARRTFAASSGRARRGLGVGARPRRLCDGCDREDAHAAAQARADSPFCLQACSGRHPLCVGVRRRPPRRPRRLAR